MRTYSCLALLLLLWAVGAPGLQAQSTDYRQGVLYLCEGAFQRHPGTMLHVTPDGKVNLKAMEVANGGDSPFGETAQYAVQQGEYYYVTSKDERQKSQLVKIEAKTLKEVSALPKCLRHGGPEWFMANENCYHFMPLDDHKGLLGTTYGLYEVNLDDMTIPTGPMPPEIDKKWNPGNLPVAIPTAIEGLPNPVRIDRILRFGKNILLEVQDQEPQGDPKVRGLYIVDLATWKVLGKLLGNYFSPCYTVKGELWCAKLNEGICRIDYTATSLKEAEVIKGVPVNANPSVMAWRPGPLAASPSRNELFYVSSTMYNPGGGVWRIMLHDDNKVQELYHASTGYGEALEDPRTGHLWWVDITSFGGPETLVEMKPDGTIVAKHKGSADQFPALPLFYRGPASPFPLEVMEFLPGPGQFINQEGFGLGEPELDTYEKKLAHLTKDFADDGQANISLGNFGGRLVFRFDHPVQNTPGDDLHIKGNYFRDNPEPAIVWVAQDRNLNGQPDPGEWYELLGACENDPEWITRRYHVTYYRPTDETVRKDYIRWEASDGTQGYVAKNNFHTQSYWPSWLKDKQSYTLWGSRLSDKMVTEKNNPHSSLGYVDGEGTTFDIANAVDQDGNPVTLSQVDFVMVQSAMLLDNGMFGEVSSEVCEIKDLHHAAAAQPTTFRKVTNSSPEIPLAIKTNGGLVRSGELVPDGSTLTVELPAAYKIKNLTANGEDILASKKYAVNGKDVAIVCEVENAYAILFTTPDPAQGTLKVTTAEGQEVRSGELVPDGTVLNVQATPEKTFLLKTLTANGENILGTKKYTVKDKDVKIVCAFEPTYAILFTTPDPAQGSLKVTTAEGQEVRSGDRVLAGTVLNVQATPEKTFLLKTLTANGENILGTKKYTVKDKDVKIVCAFEPTYAILFTTPDPAQGSLTVKRNVQKLKSGDRLIAGAYIVIEVTPAAGYHLESLTANGEDISDSKVYQVKDKDVQIVCVFSQGKATYRVIFDAPNPTQGTFKVTTEDGSEVKSGNKLPDGTKLLVEATPAAGYWLQTLMVGAYDIRPFKHYQVHGKDVVFDYLFAKVPAGSYVVTFALPDEREGSFEVRPTGQNSLLSGDPVPNGSVLEIKAHHATGYRLAELTANGEDIRATKQYTVQGKDVEIVCRYELDPTAIYAVTFDTPLQEAGALNVVADGNILKSGEKVPDGTVLHLLVVVQATDYSLLSLKANGEELMKDGVPNDFTYTVSGKDVHIEHDFVKNSEFTCVVTIDTPLPTVGALTAKTAQKSLTSGEAVQGGTHIFLEATPATGYKLVAIFVNGYDRTSFKSCAANRRAIRIWATFEPSDPNTFAVTFATPKAEQGTLSVTADGKALQAGELVKNNTQLAVTATPQTGYRLKALTANGEDIAATGQYTVKDKDVKIVCEFEIDPAQIFAVTFTAPKPEEGILTVSTPNGDLKSGDKVTASTVLTVKAQAQPGYKLKALTANGEDISATGQYTVKDKDVKIVCEFESLPRLILTQPEHGTLTAMCDGNPLQSGDFLKVGQKIAFTAKAEEGYVVKGLVINEQLYGTPYTFTCSGQDVVATAQIAPEPKKPTPVEPAVLADLRAYPNPATTTLTVEGLAAARALSLVASTGQVVRHCRLQDESILVLDVSTLPSGLYLLVVEAGDGIRTLRVVKQ